MLLPVHNAADTLASTLRSIARQSETRFECLVVDDGSQDETPRIAREVAARDPRFVLLARPHEGLVPALNYGLARCSGTFVARMDGDDLMQRKRLQLQSAALADDTTVAGVGCHVRLFPRARVTDGLRKYEQWLNSLRSPDDVARDAFIECPLAHPRSCFVGSCFNNTVIAIAAGPRITIWCYGCSAMGIDSAS